MQIEYIIWFRFVQSFQDFVEQSNINTVSLKQSFIKYHRAVQLTWKTLRIGVILNSRLI